MTADESRDAQSGVEEVLARVLAHEHVTLPAGTVGGDWQRERVAHVAAAQAAALAPLLAAERAKALRDAADRMPAFHDRDVPEWAITSACRWLRDLADREQP